MLESTCFFGKRFVKQLGTLQSQEKFVLVRKLWALPKSKCGHLDDFACSTFVEYVADELERVGRHSRLFAIQDFRGTFAMIEELSTNASRTYNDILAELSKRYPNDHPDAVRRSIELTVRLWLTLDIHSDGIRVGAESDRTPINWDLSQSLHDLLRDQPRGRTTTQRYGSSARFDWRLTAEYLVKTCGISFQWSDCIATHLDFDLDSLVLTIYRHKAILISHLVSPQRSPVPRELLEEVLSTMDLLFPFGDEPTRSLLFKEDQPSLYTLGGTYKTYPELDLARYECYGDKLEQLMEAFDGNARTWRQLALDRRNKLEWSAFWVTVMVALLTVISIPCSIIQATYSVMAYQATVSQAKAQQSEG